MTDLRQAAQQALEALHYSKVEAITALREALAQPEQEPVAWVCYGAPGKRDIDFEDADINGLPIGTNLYTTPPAAQRPWQGLTDEDKKKIATAAGCTEDDDGHIVMEIFRFVEIKLKERNT